ncbi:hypothetical protein COV27_02655 [candidate division WWE3 bacterium CG10_big_fil_rev_8_21_14_0_10_39_14]|nr:MAG: hypothetical protein COV27_02655 [candidate division WWE3 bacterium CG10_big_fil_rev_8_21_14_0_10_39_14]
MNTTVALKQLLRLNPKPCNSLEVIKIYVPPQSKLFDEIKDVIETFKGNKKRIYYQTAWARTLIYFYGL